MKFKRACCDCGALSPKLINGKCRDCHVKDFPPIRELKPITLQICNVTKQIAYNNIYYDQEEIIQKLPDIVASKICLNKGYELVDVEISDIEIVGHKFSFNVSTQCEFTLFD